MLNKVILPFLLALAILSVRADTVAVNPDHPGSYTVVKGDTLWDISARFLQEPWRWPEIWRVNPQIQDPHLIYPGDIITLSYEDEAPVLTVERETAVETEDVAVEEEPVVRQVVSDRNVKLSPRIRDYERDEAIPSIPIDAIRHFLSRPLVIDEDDMDDWPYIVSSFEQHLVAGKGTRVYVRGLPDGSKSKTYSVYRRGPAYRSRGDVVGYEALHVGEAVIINDGDPATAIITASNREILNGDRLVPQSEKDINTDFIPHPPANNVHGNIISVVDGVSEISQYQVVVVDLGEANGLETGNVLGIYQSGHVIQDNVVSQKSGGLNNTALMEYLGKFKSAGETVRLPEEFAGVVMIFRTFDRVSYGVVMQAYGAVHLNDTVKNL